MCGLPHKVISLMLLSPTKESAPYEQSEMANVPTALIVAVPNFLDRQETSPGKAQQNSAPFSPFFAKMEEKSNLAVQKLN